MDTPIATNSLVLGRVLSRHARYRPHHLAVVFGDKRLTFAEFDIAVNQWANALAGLGVVHGDRVATLLPNSLEGLATYWACAKLAAAVVPLSPVLMEDGLVSLLNDARPRTIVSTSAFQSTLSKVRRRLAYSPAPSVVSIDGEAQDMFDYATLTAEELCDWINARVAARYQRVERVVVMADFPRNAAGKTLKREMREPYWLGLQRKI